MLKLGNIDVNQLHLGDDRVKRMYHGDVLVLSWIDSPLDLAPAAWYDASDFNTMFDATTGGSPTAEGGLVARWEDKSGNGHHATSVQPPTRNSTSVPHLYFDGTGGMVTDTIDNSGSVTIFLVSSQINMSLTTLYSWGTDDGADAGRVWLLTSEATSTIRQADTTNGSNLSTKILSEHWHSDGITRQTTHYSDGTHAGHNLRIGGVLQSMTDDHTADAGSALVSKPLHIGAYVGDVAGMIGGIREMIVFDRRLTDQEIRDVEDYLNRHFIFDPEDLNPTAYLNAAQPPPLLMAGGSYAGTGDLVETWQEASLAVNATQSDPTRQPVYFPHGEVLEKPLSPLEEFRALSILNILPSNHASMRDAVDAECAWGVKCAEALNVGGGGAGSMSQGVGTDQPYAIPVLPGEPVYYGPGVDGNQIDMGFDIGTGNGIFNIQIDCVLESSNFYLMGDSGGSNFSYGMRFNGGRFEMGAAQFTLSRSVTVGSRITLEMRREGNNYFLVREKPHGGSWETLYSAAYGATGFLPDTILGKGNIASSVSNFKGACYRLTYSRAGVDLVDFDATDFGHIGTTGTDSVGNNLVISQAGNNPAFVTHKSGLRSDDQSIMTSAFDVAQTDGRVIVVAYVLANGDYGFGRIVSAFQDAGSSTDPSGIIPMGQSSNTNIRAYYNPATRLERVGAYTGKIIYELKIDGGVGGGLSSTLNGGTPLSEAIDMSALSADNSQLFGDGVVDSATIYLQELLWLPTTVTDEQVAAAIPLLAAEHDFPLV